MARPGGSFRCSPRWRRRPSPACWPGSTFGGAARGYWNREEDTAATLLEGEWLRTGDVAVRDEDGYLSLVNRKKDLIIVSGFNVYPNEVEEVLIRHPFAARSLARFKVPLEIEVVAQLPRLPTGKVLRRALRGEETLSGSPES